MAIAETHQASATIGVTEHIGGPLTLRNVVCVGKPMTPLAPAGVTVV